MKQEIKSKLAQAAARWIAEDGLDWHHARQKAMDAVADQHLGARDVPTSVEIEDAVHDYLELFYGETYRQLLKKRRQQALRLMDMLSSYEPYLAGALAQGGATEHSEIVLQVFNDTSKDLMIDLINRGFEVGCGEVQHFRGRGVIEALRIPWEDTTALICCYAHQDLRGALKPDHAGRIRRFNRTGVLALLAAAD